MSHDIKGLLHPGSEFGWSVGLLTFLPLLPLLIELLVNRKLDPSTVFLTATMYTVSIAFTCDKFWVLLAGALAIGGLMLCFGLSTALSGSSETAATISVVPENGDSTAIIRRLQSIIDTAYYIAFSVMTFFGYHQVRQRWRTHMTDLQPFFIFRAPKLQSSTNGAGT